MYVMSYRVRGYYCCMVEDARQKQFGVACCHAARYYFC